MWGYPSAWMAMTGTTSTEAGSMRLLVQTFYGSLHKLIRKRIAATWVWSFPSGSFQNLAAATLAALAIVASSFSAPRAVLALSSAHVTNYPIAFAAMSSKAGAAAKDAEGKLESAYGDLTGDTGHQVKGKAKQVQASAMNAADDLREGAKSAAKGVSDATKKAKK